MHYSDSEGVAGLVIAADETSERARHAIEELGCETSTTDWREVVEHPDVEG